MNNFKARRAMMKELLDNEELLNSTIVTEDGGIFKVHMEFVAAVSPYILGAAISAKDNCESIVIPGVSKEVMASIINFVYTGQLKLWMDMVSDLAAAGEMLGIPIIVELCRKYLKSNINDEHWLKFYTFPDYLLVPDLKNEAKSYILRHFEQIFPVSSDYLNLKYNDLVTILSSDNLNVNGEDYVFWAIMRWVEHDPITRLVHLPNLLRCIRFGLCDTQFYEHNIQSHPYIRNSKECRDITLKASRLFSIMSSNTGYRPSNPFLDKRNPFLTPRTPTEVIFVMGGVNSGCPTYGVETFDIKSERWFLSHTADCPPRAHFGMLWHKGYVYIIGGSDGTEFLNDVIRFDPASDKWEEQGCMNVQRTFVSVAALENCIYAMGGHDGYCPTNSCERYDPELNLWKMIANMNKVRSCASADTLDGKIYIAGGLLGEDILDSVECYDPETDAWSAITSMNSPRMHLNLVTYNGYLFAIGGFDGITASQTVEKYNPRIKMWKPVPDMNEPRINFATAVMYDCLYVIGGYNGLSIISQAERYDHRKKVWTPITELNISRSALAACTVKDIPNIKEYTFLGNA